MHLNGLFVYPIKSCAGLAVDAWDLDERGLVGDRSYMVVDERGDFLTQREAPQLATVCPELGERLRVTTPSGSALADPGPVREVSVWQHTGPALDCGDEVAEVLTSHLGRHCRLVALSPQHERPTSIGSGMVGFADGYPLLVATEASLSDLNARMPSPLPMNRFRPNLVVTGSSAFDEDHWLSIEIGDVAMDLVKPCARCAITRVDQTTGVRGDGEPLRTLGTFRKAKGGVMFGWHVIHRSLGTLRVGDEVRVAARRS